jgi:glycosyltransferase involved in cell wall biosynthesis
MADEMSLTPPPTAVPSDSAPPLVTVIIPTFNGGRTLPRTLGALAGQDWHPIEWLIIDDGSGDDTSRVAERFLSQEPGRGRLLVHPANWGLSRSLNQGLRESRGSLVVVLHQDLELVGSDWVTRAIRRLRADPTTGVVTGYYGMTAPDDLTFTKKAFGLLSRQFHHVTAPSLEDATFTEFKADVFAKSTLDRVGDFPERFRIAGEDIWVSYLLRQQGFRIVKDSGLEAIQRFSGRAETVGGNLVKTFGFGQAMGVVLAHFGLFTTRGSRRSPYSRSRSWFRASQPIAVAGALSLLAAYAITRDPWWVVVFGLWVVGRYAIQVLRVWSDLRPLTSSLGRALPEALATGLLGLGTDIMYSLGLLAGLLRSGSSGTV